MTPEYKKLREEVREKEKEGLMSKKQRIVLEQKIFTDLPQICVKCKRTENLTLDHIVPVQVLECFGIITDRQIVEDNYQILCRMCNMYKSGRLDFSVPNTKTVLLKLLESL